MSIWIVVGDSARARIFEAADVATEWNLKQQLNHPASRQAGTDLNTDRPGRAEERGEMAHDHEHQVFARTVAAEIDRGASTAHYERLVLVGPPKFLGLLKESLGTAAKQRLTDTLDKDYASLSARDVEARLHEQLLL